MEKPVQAESKARSEVHESELLAVTGTENSKEVYEFTLARKGAK